MITTCFSPAPMAPASSPLPKHLSSMNMAAAFLPTAEGYCLCSEKPSDVTAIEKAGNYHGAYHVLLGSISPLEGRGPSDLKIEGLIQRIKQGSLKEIIIATDADTEGETTAMYLTQLLKPLGVRLTRIGLGIPVGSNLEYADATTLSKSLESRRTI